MGLAVTEGISTDIQESFRLFSIEDWQKIVLIVNTESYNDSKPRRDVPALE